MAASKILDHMSPRYQDINPCNDFRSYVCEGFDLKKDLREDQSDLSSFTIMEEESQIVLRHLLEPPFETSLSTDTGSKLADKDILNKIQDAYNGCMAEPAIAALGSTPLLSILLNIEELYPAGKPRKEEISSHTFGDKQRVFHNSRENPLSKTISYLMGIGVEAMIAVGVKVYLFLLCLRELAGIQIWDTKLTSLSL